MPGLGEHLDAAIVDLDGTMVDTLGDFHAASSAALVELGLPAVPAGVVARHIGKGADHLLARLLEHVGAAPSLHAGLASAWRRHYQQVNGRHARVFAGVPEGLERLRRDGLRLACLTNKPGPFAQALLDRTGLATHFVHVFGGDAFERRKPDPLPVREACRALGSDPPRTLVIGDSVNDLLAGRGAGCPVALARYGYNHGEPVDGLGADALFDRLDALAWPPPGEPADQLPLPLPPASLPSS